MCSEISTILSKIPSDIAAQHEGINKKALANTMEKLEELFTPLVKWESRIRTGGRFPHFGNDVADAFLNAVTLRLRMLGSRQQSEFKWGESTEMSICCELALHSHAGTDGILLDKPKLWSKCNIWDITEDGGIVYRK